MARWMKNTCLILALAATLFCSIGYAALSDTLQITGQVQVEPPNVVYIAEIINDGYINGEHWSTQYSTPNGVATDKQTRPVAIGTWDGAPTTIDFPSTKFVSNIQYTTTKSGSKMIRGSVTFVARVVNGTDKLQYFNSVIALGTDGTGYNHDGIRDYIEGYNKYTANPRVEPFKAGDNLEIPAHGEKYLKITMEYLNEGTATKQTLFQLFYAPDFHDVTQTVSVNVVLNYDDLINGREGKEGLYEKFNGHWSYGDGQNAQTGYYISNCKGYSDTQIDLVNGALGKDVMEMEINGVKQQITVLLKQEDVSDWNDTNVSAVRQEERMIFFTADPLDTTNERVPVFVCVFYQDKNQGDWLPLGHGKLTGTTKYIILEGTATVCDKDGNKGARDDVGNFDTNTWRPSQEYFGVDPKLNETNLDRRPKLEDLMKAYQNWNPNN